MSVARHLALTTEPDRLTRMERAVEHAMEAIKSWVLSKGGTIVSDDPCVSIYEVSIHHLGELQVLVDRFKEHTNLECWSGVGNTMADSVRAADFAKKKNLDKPFLMQEDIEDSPQEAPLSVLKSEEEDLNKSLKNKLMGAGAAALLALPVAHYLNRPKPAPVAAVTEQPKTTEAKPTPVPTKLNKPLKVAKHLKGTFAENYDRATLHNGTSDAMHLIAMMESRGGKNLLHTQEKQHVNHPLTGERIHVDNTAFGHFGMRPWTAFDASVKAAGGRDAFVQLVTGKPMSELVKVPKMPIPAPREGRLINRKVYENQIKAATLQAKKKVYEKITDLFMGKFKQEPAFYNATAENYMKRLAEKTGEMGKDGYSNPLDIISSWNQGEFASKDKIKNNPVYKNMALSRLKEMLDSGMTLDFTNMFGKAGHDRLIQAAQEYQPSKIPKAPIPVIKKKK